MRGLRAPQAQHRHTELSLHLESPPILPSFRLEQGWWKAGTLPGCGDSDSANLARLWGTRAAGHILHCCSAVALPREVMKCPQTLLAWETRCHHSQISDFTNFYLSEDLKLP